MHRSSRPFAVPLLVLLADLWSFLAGSQADNGCEFDPNGRCGR